MPETERGNQLSVAPKFQVKKIQYDDSKFML